MTTVTLLEQVQDYINAGIYSLIPLKHGTKNKPLIDWKPYQKRLPSRSEKTAWFSSLCNIAAILGQTARLVAIDVDGDGAKQRVERKLVEMGYCNNLRVSMLDTMMTLTGSGGFHFVFYVDPKLFDKYDLRTKTLWSGSSKHEEIKFLGKGSIVMLAPSLHPNGSRQYQWNERAPIELSERQLTQLLEVFCEKYLPTTLEDVNNNNTSSSTVEEKGDHPPSTTSISAIRQSILQPKIGREPAPTLSLKETYDLIKALKPAYKVGRRNAITLGYAGVLRKRSYALHTVEDFCVVVCKTFNDEEIESRLRAVRDTFKKSIDKIAGWGWLNDIG
jgi:hypothetical protein